MYYYYYQPDFGTEMARKAILKNGELVSCFRLPSLPDHELPRVCFAPYNAVLPGFGIKAFVRLLRERAKYRRLPLADLDTAEVLILDGRSFRVRLPVPRDDAKVWRYDGTFSSRTEIETRNEIVVASGPLSGGTGTDRLIAEFDVENDMTGYAVFSVEQDGWHRQFAFQWDPEPGSGDRPAPRLQRRAAALALLDGEVAEAGMNPELRCFFQTALLAMLEVWLDGSGENEMLEKISSHEKRQELENLLLFKLPALPAGGAGQKKASLLAYKHECLLSLGKNLPAVDARGDIALGTLLGGVRDVLNPGPPAAGGGVVDDKVAIALDAFWREVTG